MWVPEKARTFGERTSNVMSVLFALVRKRGIQDLRGRGGEHNEKTKKLQADKVQGEHISLFLSPHFVGDRRNTN